MPRGQRARGIFHTGQLRLDNESDDQKVADLAIFQRAFPDHTIDDIVLPLVTPMPGRVVTILAR
jgi:hypothetical protein